MPVQAGPYRTRNSGATPWRQPVDQTPPRAIATTLLPTPLDRPRGAQSFPAARTTEPLKRRTGREHEPVVTARPVATNFFPAGLSRLLVMTLARRFRGPLAGTFRSFAPLTAAFSIAAALFAPAGLSLLTGPILLLSPGLRPAAGGFATRRAAVVPSRAAGKEPTPATFVQALPRPWLARGTLKSPAK